MVNLWKHIARHYRDNPYIAAYDLLNEPLQVPSAEVFNEFYDRAVDGIRQFDQNHLIFLEGDHFHRGVKSFNRISLADNFCKKS